MEISYVGDDYNLYSVPILLNGLEYNLNVVYNFTDAQYSIPGARKGSATESGMADKNLRQPVPGDKITTLHYIMSITWDDTDYQQVEVDTLTVTDKTSFDEVDMGDGSFLMYFEMVDAQNNSTLSNPVTFTVEGDTITTEVD